MHQHIFKILWVFASVTLNTYLSAQHISADRTVSSDPLADLKQHIARQLILDLEPRVDAALKSAGEWPRNFNEGRPYKLSLFLRMGQEPPTGSLKSETDVLTPPKEYYSPRFIAAIDARVVLLFLPRDPTIDIKLKKILTQYFNERGSVQSLTLQPNKPLLHLDVSIKPMRHHFGDALRRNLILFIMASLVFLILTQLETRVSIRKLAKPRHDSRIDPKIIFPVPSAVAISSPMEKPLNDYGSRVHIRPTAGYQYLQEMLRSDIQLGVKEGSWYLYSLPEISTLDLQSAFQKMPFDQAIKILRILNSHYKIDIANRLELVPALMRDPKRPGTNAETVSEELLKSKEFRQNSTMVDKKWREHQTHDGHELH